MHSECNQVCEKLGLACKRPDAESGEGATVRVVDDADLFCKDDDMVDFICDLCLKISKLEFSVYKERTMDEEHNQVVCNDCTKHLEVNEVVKCNYPGCKGTYEYQPYFFEMMGFSLPKKCEECRKLVKATCCHCKSTQTVKYHEWKKSTQEGKVDFLCRDCLDGGAVCECQNCHKKHKVALKRRRLHRRFVCDLCRLRNRNEVVRCRGKNCRRTLKWLQAFEAFDDFSESKPGFTCKYCRGAEATPAVEGKPTRAFDVFEGASAARSEEKVVKEAPAKAVAAKPVKVRKLATKVAPLEKKAASILKDQGLQGLESIWQLQDEARGKPKKTQAAPVVVSEPKDEDRLSERTEETRPDSTWSSPRSRRPAASRRPAVEAKYCHVCNYRLGKPWYKWCSNHLCRAPQLT